MKFSVLVPVYNGEQCIVRAMESVKKQTYTDWELIIVNDGSTDKTLTICKKLEEQDSRIRVIDKPNSGVSDSRNQAIEASKGDYLVFLDADDILNENCLEELNLCIGNQDYQLVISNYCITQINERENARKISRTEDICDIKEVSSLIDFSLKMNVWKSEVWYGNLRSVACGKCFSSKFIQDYNIRFVPGLKYGEDMVFLLTYLTKITRIRFLDKVLYCYIMNKNSAMHTRQWEGFLQGELYYNNVENLVNKFCDEHDINNDFQEALGALWLETVKADWDCILATSFSISEKRKLLKYHLNSEHGVRFSKKEVYTEKRQALYMFFIRNKWIFPLVLLCYIRKLKRQLAVQDV